MEDNWNNPLYTVNLNAQVSINLPNECDPGNGFIASSVEQVNSGKYSYVETILNKITRAYKNIPVDIYDIAEWSGECEIDEIAQYQSFALFRSVRIKVINNKALLPCNVWRVLSVYRNKCTVPKYDWDGAYLRFNFDDNRTMHEEYFIEVDYMGIMVDERGFPLILQGHEEACFWYCLTKMFLEKYTAGEIPENRYMFFQAQLGNYVMRAKGSMKNMSRDDLNEIAMIRYNMIQKVRMSRNVA